MTVFYNRFIINSLVTIMKKTNPFSATILLVNVTKKPVCNLSINYPFGGVHETKFDDKKYAFLNEKMTPIKNN